MSAAASWILSVTAAAIVSAVVRSLAGKGSIGTLVQYLTGIFLILTVLSPLIQQELPDMGRWFDDYRYEGETAAEEGRHMAIEKTRELIKSRIEAYILDKAAAYDAAPAVDVQVDDSGIPISVTVRGSIPRAAKAKLVQILETELGIGKEDQHWIE